MIDTTKMSVRITGPEVDSQEAMAILGGGYSSTIICRSCKGKVKLRLEPGESLVSGGCLCGHRWTMAIVPSKGVLRGKGGASTGQVEAP